MSGKYDPIIREGYEKPLNSIYRLDSNDRKEDESINNITYNFMLNVSTPKIKVVINSIETTWSPTVLDEDDKIHINNTTIELNNYEYSDGYTLAKDVTGAINLSGMDVNAEIINIYKPKIKITNNSTETLTFNISYRLSRLLQCKENFYIDPSNTFTTGIVRHYNPRIRFISQIGTPTINPVTGVGYTTMAEDRIQTTLGEQITIAGREIITSSNLSWNIKIVDDRDILIDFEDDYIMIFQIVEIHDPVTIYPDIPEFIQHALSSKSHPRYYTREEFQEIRQEFPQALPKAKKNHYSAHADGVLESVKASIDNLPTTIPEPMQPDIEKIIVKYNKYQEMLKEAIGTSDPIVATDKLAAIVDKSAKLEIALDGLNTYHEKMIQMSTPEAAARIIRFNSQNTPIFTDKRIRLDPRSEPTPKRRDLMKDSLIQFENLFRQKASIRLLDKMMETPMKPSEEWGQWIRQFDIRDANGILVTPEEGRALSAWDGSINGVTIPIIQTSGLTNDGRNYRTTYHQQASTAYYNRTQGLYQNTEPPQDIDITYPSRFDPIEGKLTIQPIDTIRETVINAIPEARTEAEQAEIEQQQRDVESTLTRSKPLKESLKETIPEVSGTPTEDNPSVEETEELLQ